MIKMTKRYNATYLYFLMQKIKCNKEKNRTKTFSFYFLMRICQPGQPCTKSIIHTD